MYKRQVHEDVTRHLIASLVAGEVDIALLALPIEDERIETETLFSEPLRLALPPGHALEKRRRISSEHLQNERFIILGDMHCLGDQVLSFCRVNNCGPRIGCRSAQITTIQELIMSGQGISLLPQMAISKPAKAGAKPGKGSTPFSGDTPIYREFADAPSRTIVAAWHRHRYLSVASQRFLEELRALLKDNPHKGSTPEATKRGGAAT